MRRTPGTVVAIPSSIMPHEDALPFDADAVMRRLRDQVATFPQTAAAMFMMADEGYASVFEQVVSAVISIRTYEEVTLPASRRLFAVARTPAAVADLSFERIDELISPCTYHEAKARQIHDIAIAARDEHGGELPCDFEVLTGFRGVGPKVANLAIAVACDRPHGIPVDIHVHRITNRWGIYATKTPEATRKSLEKTLPRRYWAEINRLLVPFGKFVCTASRPKCDECAVRAYCRQIGVR